MSTFARSHGTALAITLVIGSLLSLATPARAVIDAPDTCAIAAPIAVDSHWTSEAVAVAGDRDWYTFTLATPRHVLATLGSLRIDARLALYGSCATAIASSDRSGIQYEEIDRTLPAGTYRIRVDATGGAASARLYALRVRAIPAKVIVLSSSGWEPYPTTFPDRPRIVGEVLNGTAQAREDVRIRVRLYDAADTLIATRHTWARRERLSSGKRSMFVWHGETFAGYDHYRLSVAEAPLAGDSPLWGLVVHPGGTTPDGYGGLTYWGALENTTDLQVGVPRVMVTVYDALGGVRNADFIDTDPDPMAAHSSNDYEVYLADRTTGNRVVIVAHGYRH